MEKPRIDNIGRDVAMLIMEELDADDQVMLSTLSPEMQHLYGASIPACEDRPRMGRCTLVHEGKLPDEFKHTFVFIEPVKIPVPRTNRFTYRTTARLPDVEYDELPPAQIAAWNIRCVDGSEKSRKYTVYTVAPNLATDIAIAGELMVVGQLSIPEGDRNRLDDGFREYNFEFYVIHKQENEIKPRNTGAYRGVDTWSPDRTASLTVAQRFHHYKGAGINKENPIKEKHRGKFI